MLQISIGIIIGRKAGLRRTAFTGGLTRKRHRLDFEGTQHGSQLSGLLSAAGCGDMSVHDAHGRYSTTVKCLSVQDFPERQHYFLVKRFVLAAKETEASDMVMPDGKDRSAPLSAAVNAEP